MPSMPRPPKPPGMRIPSISCRNGSGPSFSTRSESTHCTSTRASFAIPPCVKASLKLLYESLSWTYLPTIPMVTAMLGFLILATICSHSLRSGRLARGQVEIFDDDLVQAFLMQNQRQLVDRIDILGRDHRLFLDVGEQRDLGLEVAGSMRSVRHSKIWGSMPISRKP